MKRNDSSYLELFIGPMYSGKTSKLLELYRQHSFCNQKICVYNWSDDKRYSETLLSSHDRIMIPCDQIKSFDEVKKEKNLNDKFINADVIIINEGQFFPDLFSFVKTTLEATNKILYIGGLDGDFKTNKIGQILELIPLCDKVTKLTSLCSKCKNGTPAIFSHRLSNENEQIIIGSSNYIPLCRKCYYEINIKKKI